MKKNNIFKAVALSALSICSLAITSCDQDDDLRRGGKPVLTITENTFNVIEGASADITFSQTFPVLNVTNTNIGNVAGSEMRIEVVGGTAQEGIDYTFNIPTIASTSFGFWGGEGYYLNLPGETTINNLRLSDILTVNQDSDTEGTETIELRFYPAGIAQAVIDETITINIEDIVPSRLDVTLDFSGNITTGGTTYDKCLMDFDFIPTAAGSTAPDYANGLYTGNCQEGPLSFTNIANDMTTYYLITDLWNTGTIPQTESVDIPLSFNINKVDLGTNTIVSTETVTLPNLYQLDNEISDDGSPFGDSEGEKLALRIVVDGNTFTVYDMSNNQLAQSRFASSNNGISKGSEKVERIK